MDKTQPFEVPSGRVARGRVTAPPSKSHAIRALVCAALADGTSTLHGLSRCDAEDVQRTIVALRTLGFAIDGDSVTGAGGRIPNPNVTLDLGGSGTAFRFLTAVAALGPGPTTLTGDASLRRRPMDEIVRAIRGLGVSVKATCGPLCMTAPLTVTGGPPRRAQVDVDASASSQEVSALLLIGPTLPAGLTVRVQGAAASRPYVFLTSHTMLGFKKADTDCGQVGDGLFRGGEGGYRSVERVIAGDWSSAAFIIAAAVVTHGDVSIGGLSESSGQADEKVLDLFDEDHFGGGFDVSDGTDPDRVDSVIRAIGDGSRRPLDVDLRDAPDLAPLVGALGCVASGTTRVRGAAHLRLKESDRIATVVAAARALGCDARELPDGFEIVGPAKHGGLIETNHDHRIAMAFAVAGLAVSGVVIDDPACVAKSYPGFWDDLARLIGDDG